MRILNTCLKITEKFGHGSLSSFLYTIPIPYSGFRCRRTDGFRPRPLAPHNCGRDTG
ncbi:hypothetical protein BC941DRAFT_445412 [Chlamydoabsidia padenii]|nr:hypothetical protein BC941DRAFT_445412 [Chlamydoabsidia padenii]